VAETRAVAGATPIAIEIGGAVVRIGSRIGTAILGKVLCLSKAMR
jgi:hypothetical protein